MRRPIVRLATTALAMAALGAVPALAAKHAQKPARGGGNTVILVNESSRQIERINLTPSKAGPDGRKIVRSYHFIYKVDGEDRNSAWLFKGLTGRVVFPDGFSLRPQCVFDVSIGLADSASFYRAQQNLCLDPKIVVTDLEVRVPRAAAIAAAPEAAPSPSAGHAQARRAPTDFVEFYYNAGVDAHFSYSPGSVRSEGSVRWVAWTDSTLQRANHGAERIIFHARLDCAAHTIQSLWTDSFSTTDGSLVRTVDLSGTAAADPYGPGTMAGRLADRVC